MDDLVVLVADTDAEWTLRTLLEERWQALGIRQLACNVIRNPGRDAGTFRTAHEILKIHINKYRCAIVLLDYHGSGVDHKFSPQQAEKDLEDRLKQTGWECVTVIIFDPELEVWVWSKSSHVARELGLTEQQLADLLMQAEKNELGKPKDPKAVMEKALKISRRPLSSKIFQELAKKVSLQVNERAFDRLRNTLKTWFPIEE